MERTFECVMPCAVGAYFTMALFIRSLIAFAFKDRTTVILRGTKWSYVYVTLLNLYTL